jgi:acetylornithine deacetylase/succinyl-diaminopimelate desuccinylase-like protein
MIIEQIKSAIKSEEYRLLEELKSFLRFKSISTNPAFKSEIYSCANWLVDNFKSIGLNSRLIETETNPLVYAEYNGAGIDKPTILVYGHYDVQPEVPIELWNSDPFEPVVKDGYIYGRGTADDKGQVFTHIKAIEILIKNNIDIPVNVKFIIEGEEESGGEAIEKFLLTNSELLSCDCILISDTEWYDGGDVAKALPAICYSLRGIGGFEMTVIGPNRDLHSGSYGGAVANPINILCEMIAKVKNEEGLIQIPNYYVNVLPLSSDERMELAKLDFNESEYKRDLNVNSLTGEVEYSVIERTSARPTFDVNGIFGGYTDEGHKSIIPSRATAKFSFRIVPNQTWQEAVENFKIYFISIAPDSVRLEFRNEQGGNPVLAPIDSKGVLVARKALKDAFDLDSVLMREGGSIPIVSLFQEQLKAPAVLMALGLSTDNIHSPNENFALSHYYGGILASALFLTSYE